MDAKEHEMKVICKGVVGRDRKGNGDIDSRRTVERDGKMRGARGELSYGDKNVRR